MTFYISHKKLKNTARVLSARLSNVSEMRYFSTHTIHTWASPLLRAPRRLNTHCIIITFFSYVTFDIHGQRKGYAQPFTARGTQGHFTKTAGALSTQNYTVWFSFSYYYLATKTALLSHAGRARARSLRAQRHPRPIQECLHCVLMHAEEHSSAFIKVKCSVTYSKRRASSYMGC